VVHGTPDAQLVARAQGGDVAAFEAILEPVIEPAHRFACALLRDPDLAQDVIQEACVRAWRKIGRLRPEAPILPWFLGIVARQCRDQMRGRWWQVIRTAGSLEVTPSELPEDAALRRELLRELLGRLPPRECQVLVLRLYLDLPWSSVAGAAGLTEAGARTRYYRALKRIRPGRDSQEVLT